MQQLSPQDAVFLSIETPELPSHVGGLAFLEPNEEPQAFYARFVEFVQERLSLCERFRWALQEVPFGLDRPYWVEARSFDAADHIQRMALPSPGGAHELSEITGLLFERPLDRDRPLWEMFLIEGVSGGRCALLWKVHHCLMDGSSGANLIQQLFDIGPDVTRAAHVETTDTAAAGQRVATRPLIERALRNASELPRVQRRYIERAARKVFEARQEKAESASAPRAPFNGQVGKRRRLSWSSVPLEDVKKLKNTLSVTVNDVVLAMTSGAIRSYLMERGQLPEETLVASVPSSTRQADDHTLGNQVQDLIIPWATDLEDPIERLLQIHDSANDSKARAAADDSISLIGAMAETLLPGALQMMIRGAAAASDRVPLPANAVVSNVPMTPFPLYCAGAKISQVVPFSLLGATQGLNITVLSYCGELHFGLAHDPELVPDAWALAEQIPKNFQQLQSAVDEKLDPSSI